MEKLNSALSFKLKKLTVAIQYGFFNNHSFIFSDVQPMFWFKLKVWLTSGLKTNCFRLHCLVFKEQLDFSSAALLKRLVYYILSLSECQALFQFLFQYFLWPIKALYYWKKLFCCLPFPLATCIMIHALAAYVNTFFAFSSTFFVSLKTH